MEIKTINKFSGYVSSPNSNLKIQGLKKPKPKPITNMNGKKTYYVLNIEY